MATLIRPEISEKNKYWISKHRHYELKHFCLQYPNWKRSYSLLNSIGIGSSLQEKLSKTNVPGDPTGKQAIIKAAYEERIKMVEQAAFEADEYLYLYILKGVTEGITFTTLKSKYGIPCGRDMYYDRYRKFFWLLNKERQ